MRPPGRTVAQIARLGPKNGLRWLRHPETRTAGPTPARKRDAAVIHAITVGPLPEAPGLALESREKNENQKGCMD
ncbi:hypothetical protein NDU88_006009 [Pleurodeles waltl]|uniref:Uncharacterized protein n=1 Tax=Pleurodeles waltl TaxID=8319 RepID=A0AAV7TWE8_PLEWA|nr:hypothetical protein NDU88_006009 [Pleurodeles waltl]